MRPGVRSRLTAIKREIRSANRVSTQHFDVQQSTAAMVHLVNQLMLFIPFGHLFVGGRKDKKINLDAATVSPRCDTSLWKPY